MSVKLEGRASARWPRVGGTGVAGDGLRALWAMLYWNVRKSAFVLGGRKGAAPCQHQLDVQDGLPPRCEAVWHWAGPGRFRRVCPLLMRTAEGWCCSVRAEQVRPFWGRAFVVYALLATCLYLAGVGGFWGFLRTVGYREIAFSDVAWPGNWVRIKPAQAAYFRAQGREAMARGDFPAALLALSTAERFNRGGYEERLFLARMWAQQGNVGFADQVFESVVTDFPDRAREASVVWHDQLLAVGAFEALADLCLRQIAQPENGGGLWAFSLLFALDHGRLAHETNERDAAHLVQAPLSVRELIGVLAQWQRGDNDGAAARLSAMRFAGDERLLMRLQVEWLARLGRPGEAGVALSRWAGALGSFEVAALRYTIDVASGDRDAARANFVGLLRDGPLELTEADRLCALVIEAQDGASLRRTPGFFALAPLNADARTQAAFWVAARACNEPSLVAGARARYEWATGGETLPIVAELDFRKQNAADRGSPLFIASFVPLPRATIYALIAVAAETGRKH